MVRSLRVKMLATGVGVIVVMGAFMLVQGYRDYRYAVASTRRAYLDRCRTGLRVQVNQIVEGVRFGAAELGLDAMAGDRPRVRELLLRRLAASESPGRIFVTDVDGLVLFDGVRPERVGKKMTEAADAYDRRVFDECVRIARTTPAGGFMTRWRALRPDAADSVEEICFVRAIEPWGLMVGAAADVDEIHRVVIAQKRAGRARMRGQVAMSLGCLTAMLVAVTWITRETTGRVTGNLELFRGFFRRAATTHSSIALDRIHYAEFVDLAEAANAMIASRREALAALRRSERRYARAQRAGKIGCWSWDARTGEFYWSEQMEHVFGWDVVAGAVSDVDLLERVHPEDRTRVVESIEACVAGGEGLAVEHRIIAPDGAVRWAAIRGEVIRDDGGAPARILGVVQEITGRKEAEQEILTHRRRLQELTSELSLTEEREHRRLAEALHDGLGQSLFAIKMNLASLRPRKTSAETIERWTRVFELVDGAIAEARRITFELCPPVLYESGLPAAIEWLAGRFARRTGIRCEASCDGDPPALDDDLRSLAYRGVRELLINVGKHADASCVRIHCERIDGAARVSVTDDGVGFDATAPTERMERGGGFGLFHLRERFARLRGAVEIESRPGAGCRVVLTIPVAEAAEKGNGE